MKPCFVCLEIKPLDQFDKHVRMKDGHLNKCKACKRIYEQGYRSRQPGGRKADRQKRYLRELETGARSRKAPQKYGRDRDAVKVNSLRYFHKRRAKTVLQTEFDEFVFGEAVQLRLMRERVTGGKWHVDHIVPLHHRSASGLHNGFNFQVVPAVWNVTKRNKTMETYFTKANK